MSIPWTVDTSGLEASGTGLVTVAANQARATLRLAAVAQEAGLATLTSVTDARLEKLSNGPEALVLTTDGVTAGQIILALEEAHINLPLFGQVNVGSPQLIQVAREAANGLIFVSPGPAPADVEAETFAEAYQALAGFPPGPRAVLAYDATQVLLDAIEQSILKNGRRPTRLEVSEAIPTVQRTGLSGQITFNRQGERVEAPVWVYQIFREEYPGMLLTAP
jgi:branched-chain amino acid transport system substrate-binding protein